jgi:two-component system, NarL family, nitrate/nitrite response regulator NarL
MAISATNEANVVAMLTNREREIMRLVSIGLSNKEIGRRLNIAEHTLRLHLHNIFEKMEIGTEPRSQRSP